MGWTGHSRIGCNLNGEKCNSKDKTGFKGSKFNIDLI